MEALIQGGESGRAARLAAEYLRLHPESPHRARLEEIVHLAEK
jgi:hypothetical protein